MGGRRVLKFSLRKIPFQRFNINRSIRRFIFICLLLTLLLPALAVSAQNDASPKAVLLQIEGPLTPVMADYIQRGLDIAVQDKAAVVIIQLNTPGGNIDLMNRMIEIIRASQVPVAVYVSPNGAMAGSAGTLITLAGHLSAMAPETAIGAASPVDISGQNINDSTMEAKVKSILKATARSLTEKRGATAIALAEDTIENARAASASEALKAGLIDFIATNVDDLLRQMDGKSVTLNGASQVIHTQGAQLVTVTSTFIERVLNLLTNPNLVLVLLNVGVLAILIELSSPGGWVAGFVGVICLALSVYGLGYLPVNWFGIIFMVLAFVLFVVDIKAPTHGALTIAGVGSFVVGALVLFNSPNVPPFQRVSVPLVIGSAVFTAALFFGMLTLGLRAQRRPVVTGRETIVGRTGIARSEIDPRGTVQVGGEQWSADLAEGSGPIHRNERIVVVSLNGLRVKVRKSSKPALVETKEEDAFSGVLLLYLSFNYYR